MDFKKTYWRMTVKTVILLLIFSAGKAQTISQKIHQIVFPTDTLFELHHLNDSRNRIQQFGKESIPVLIDMIGFKETAYIGADDYYSSMLVGVAQKGIRAAYMIDFLLSGSDSSAIYDHGVIITDNRNGKIIYSIHDEDLLVIQKLYNDWWIRNKGKSFSELQKEWRIITKRPLQGSVYRWY